MFNFTTATIINSDKDLQSGKALFSSIAADANHGAILRIKRDFTFEMPAITKVFKREAHEAKMCELTLDCTELLKLIPADTVYPVSGRIAIYVALEGSEESIFANDFYQKGHPFNIGYLIKDANVTATELATQIKKLASKYNLAQIGRKVFDVTAKDAVVTFKGTGEFERFKAFAVLMDEGITETELVHLFDGETDNTQSVITVVARGAAGFGTFSHLSKDIVLPTAANTSWTALYKENKPVPGTLYNQYIITYNAPSLTNPSFVAVGHETKSKTTHCFWVSQAVSEAFETCITEVVGSAPVENDKSAIFESVVDA